MLAKWMEYALGVRMTLVSGLFLAASAYFHVMGEHPTYDPGWGSFFISGVPIIYGAIYWLYKERLVTSWLLISIAMAACIVLDEVFAAAEVAWIIALGEILETKTVSRARRGLTELLEQAPTRGRVVTADGVHTEVVDAERIQVGDVLRVLPGETIPVDGEVISGLSSVNEAMITGESMPADKHVGSTVYGGTINGFGTMDIRAVKVGEDSSMQRLVRLVREAAEQQAPVQRIVDRWVAYLIPLALVLSLVTLAANYFWGISLTDSIYRAVTVLVVFCPCALALATPTAMVAAIGQATKSGVMIKSGAALEEMGRIDTVALDKTGTMTSGKMSVVKVWTVTGDPDELVRLAASVEAHSEHPLGKALVAYGASRGIALVSVTDFSMESGRGVQACIGTERVYVGNESYLRMQGIGLPETGVATAQMLRQEGKIIIWVACGMSCMGLVAFADTVREAMPAVVQEMCREGIRTVMLTGDNVETAAYVGRQVGVHEVNARLLPEDKAAYIEGCQRAGARIAMVGDGVNDAISLRKAQVGIAIGGTAGDMAIEAADMVIPGEDVTRLAYLFRLARATMRTVHINIFIALGLNLGGAVLSLFGWLTPVTGAIVHNAGSILVALHAISLYERNFERQPQTGEAVPDHCIHVRCIECGDMYCVHHQHRHQAHSHVS